MEDNELIIKCQSGDKRAFQELIAKYHPYIFKFLIKIIGNNDLAEDLTQDTFIKIIRNIEKFDINGKAKFSTYVITVAKNTYIDYYRKNKNSINISLDENLNLRAIDIEEVVFDKIDYEDVMKCFDKLTEEQRLVIRMKYIEGLTLKEIGEKLDLEPKTIKSRIHNGVVKLRKMLWRGEQHENN
jgi:RNA polymerase sigma-70 factor (ECF subfamily)